MATVSSVNKSWKDLFFDIKEFLFANLAEGENLNLNLSSEETHFLRFNQSKVRQATAVEQGRLSFELKWNKRVVHGEVELSLNREQNRDHLKRTLESLQEEIRELPEDPFYSEMTNEGESFAEMEGVLPSCDEFVGQIKKYCQGLDLAGYFTSGLTCRGNANSLGQNHWFQSSSFFFDYSLYSAKEKAVKGSYAGSHFNSSDLEASLQESAQSLKVMDQEQVELKPGKYRCYLAPAAVGEIAGILGWHALSGGAYKRGECPLGDLYEKKAGFSPLVTWRENFTLGLNPRFNSWGESSAEMLTLVEEGQMKDILICRDTANEYGLTSNQANRGESPRSLEMLTGDLELDDILKEIGTGLFISNLHYLNWSDKNKGRLTGMTRFGCLWVEEGKIVGPIKDLRFDETLYHIFGAGLERVTSFSHTIMETDTYHQRGLGGFKLPGLLVNDFTFTL